MALLTPRAQDTLFRAIKAGQCTTYKDLRTCAVALRDAEAQADMLGSAAKEPEPPSGEEQHHVRAFERQVEQGAAHPVLMTANAIAKFCDCKIWLHRDGSKIVYFGFQVDTEVAEYLTLLFKRAIDRESAAYLLFNPEYDAANKPQRREMPKSFCPRTAVLLGLSEIGDD